MDSTVRKSIGPLRLRELEGFGNRMKKLGVNFAVSDAKGELVLVCEGGRFKSRHKKHLKSPNLYMNLLVRVSPPSYLQLFKFLVRRAGKPFHKVVLRRLLSSRVNRAPVGISRLYKHMAKMQ